MFNKEQFFITIITLLSITNINAITNEKATEFVQNQQKNEFLSYLLNPRKNDILSLLKNDIRDILRVESESNNVSDALYELYSADLDNFDAFKGEKTYDELKLLMEEEIKNVITQKDNDLKKGNYKIVLKAIESVYKRYLTSFTNLLDKQDPKDNENFHFELNLKIDFDTQIINFYNELFKDQEFLKNQTNAQAVHQLVTGDLNEANNELAQNIYNAQFIRVQYIKLRKENGLDYFQKIKTLLYTITRNMETENMIPELVQRFSELSKTYLKIMNNLEDESLKLSLFDYLGAEKSYLDELNLNKDDSTLTNFNQLVSEAVRQVHAVDSDLTQKSISKLYTNLNFSNPDKLISFFKKVFSQYNKEIFANWETSKDVNSLMMTEVLVYSNLENVELEMDNFVKHIKDLLMVSSKMVSNSSINNLLLMGNCLDDILFNYIFYRNLLNYRLKNYNQNFSKEMENKKFDQFLDNNVDTLSQRWMFHMKILNIMALTNTAEDDYLVNIPKLEETLVNKIMNNHEKQCETMDNIFISIANIYDKSVKDYAGAIRSLNNLNAVRIGDVKKILSFTSESETQNINHQAADQKTYNVGVGLETGGGNLNGAIINKKVTTDNRIGETQNNENILKVIAGGDLTRKEIDILKNPNVLDTLKNGANQDNNVVINNEDGSVIRISYIQVVTNNSDCYNEISKLKVKRI